MRSLTDRMLVFLLSIFLVSYAFYQGYVYFSVPYKTETAYEYTIADSLTGKAVFIRDETLINQTAMGAMYYPNQDGTKVLTGDVIAQSFNSEDDVLKSNEIKSLEKKIVDLKTLPTDNGNKTSNADLINKQVSTLLYEIKHDVDSGILLKVKDNSIDLAQKLSKKSIVSGKDMDIIKTINYYESQVSNLKSQISSVQSKFYSPISGYFVSSYDGLESSLTTKNAEELSASFLKEITENPPILSSNYIGKMIVSHNWYIAMPILKEDVYRFKIGSTVNLDFLSIEEYDVPGVIRNIINDDNGENYALISCNYVSPDLISMRVGDVKIRFKSFTGLRVNSSSIRFVDMKKGVYVLDDHMLKFKNIDVIYEEMGYALVDGNSAVPNSLKQFDQVILEGVDIYDGKEVER